MSEFLIVFCRLYSCVKVRGLSNNWKCQHYILSLSMSRETTKTIIKRTIRVIIMHYFKQLITYYSYVMRTQSQLGEKQPTDIHGILVDDVNSTGSNTLPAGCQQSQHRT